ncbi:hypothetical protein Tco_0459420 [Tanacetum coccineum]
MGRFASREDLIKCNRKLLKKVLNRISFQKTSKVLMQAWDKFLEIKHAQSEDVQELLNKLVEDVRSINEELAEFTNTPTWNLPNTSYDDDDDEESSIPLKYIIIYGLPPEDEHKKCLKIVTFESTLDSEIMEKKSVIARLNKVSSPDGDYLVIYRANGNFRAFNYLMEGDLKIMIESSTEGNEQSDFWSGQQDWKIVT